MCKRFFPIMVLITIISVTFIFNSVSASAASLILSKGTRGNEVTSLQNNLKTLSYFNVNTTGYYGSITTSSVKKVQVKYGLVADGIAGPKTFALIQKLLGTIKSHSTDTVSAERSAVSRSSTSSTSAGSSKYLMPWFSVVNKIFPRGMTAKIYDIDSGLSFNIRRSFGENHADCEPLTAADTKIMKEIYGGTWSWSRHAIIVTLNDGKNTKIAASMNGMPHAGVDSKPADITVTGRSSGYGTGINLDEVKGNDMDGHFCVHFLGSKLHVNNKVDPEHQKMVQKAAAWADSYL